MFIYSLRPVGNEEGGHAKLYVEQSIEELRKIGANSQPPVNPPNLRSADLVNLRSLEPTLKFDIRYATE